MATRSKVSPAIRNILRTRLSDEKIISPVIEEHLARGEKPLSEKTAKRIMELLTTPPRDRSGSFSASGISGCLRRQEFSFLGMPRIGIIDARLQHVFENGKWTHLRWQAELLEAGLLDEIEPTFFSKSRLFRGTMDGIGVATRGRYIGRRFGFELKTANEWRFRTQDAGDSPDDKTLDQVHFNMWLSGYDLFVVIVEDKSTQNWHEWIIRRDSDRIERVKETARQLSAAKKQRRFHPMLPECKKKEGPWKPGPMQCPFAGDGGVCIKAGKEWP